MKQSTIRALDTLLNEAKENKSYEGLPVTFNSKPGLDPTDSDSLATMAIPSDYKDLLKRHNGFTLYQYEDLGGFQFLELAQIIPETRLQKENYEDVWDDKIFVICNVIADGDFIGLKIIEDRGYEVIDCYHDEAPQNWKVITDSLDDFFMKLIDSNGERYWLK